MIKHIDIDQVYIQINNNLERNIGHKFTKSSKIEVFM